MRKNIIICIASGPSLLKTDIEKINNCIKIVVNRSYEWVPDCDYLVAGDYQLWTHHYLDIKQKTKAQLFTRSKLASTKYNINLLENNNKTVCSSGQLAIELALTLQPSKILLLGYDCSIKNGLHFHGKHIEALDNPTQKLTQVWKSDLLKIAQKSTIKIINCSRYTEIDCFPVSTIEKELNLEQ